MQYYYYYDYYYYYYYYYYCNCNCNYLWFIGYADSLVVLVSLRFLPEGLGDSAVGLEWVGWVE